MTEYFIHDGVKEVGPFTLIQLTSQNIRPQTPMWHKGLSSWTTAGALEELQPLLNSRATPPPFSPQPNTPPPFVQPSSSGLKTYKPYIIAGLILLGGSVAWYVSANSSDTPPYTEGNSFTDTPVDSAAVSLEEIERQRINQELTAKNMNYRNNWSRFI